MNSEDWSTRGDMIEKSVVKQIATWATVYTTFCTSAKAEMALLLKVQAFCYEDSRFIKHFRIIVQNLYKHDIVTEDAILYWFDKGASQQGKTILLKQMEAFVKWLREQESESDED